MDNLFDHLRDASFDIVTRTMGKIAATWQPAAGGDPFTADVLFNDPNSVRKLGDVEFNPTNTVIEWRKPFFPGLKESADANESEYVTIGSDVYYVRTVVTVHDGNNYVAVLQINT